MERKPSWTPRTARPRGIRNVGLVGSYVPRRCGIATFSNDLVSAIGSADDQVSIDVVALNDRPEAYAYPQEVKFEIAQNVLGEYRQAADFLNMNAADAVCVQHEFGIFGGDDGAHILGFLKQLHAPVVVTLHTILRDPSPSQRAQIREIGEVSDALVVMTETGRRYLEEIYGVDPQRIAVIPHGIPDVPFVDPCFYKDRFGVERAKVILTFGLLSPNKGIETMIRALPAIVRVHPDVMYLVLGATHPHVKEHSGESYRRDLQRLAHELGVESHLQLHDRYVDLTELCQWLGAADVYVTPYLNQEQIVSGTLAYAMGTGNAVVSTPYWHAVEMLAEGRGALVDFGDSDGFAAAINRLLTDNLERDAIRKRAYGFTRQHVWRSVGQEYLELFSEVIDRRRHAPRPILLPGKTNGAAHVPEVKLDHLYRLTDDVGILQHAKYQIPDRDHGYCTDDNARALIVALKLRQHAEGPRHLDDLLIRYLAFLRHAFNPATGAFRNFMGYDRCWHEKVGAPDAHGRALWAAGELAGKAYDRRIKEAGLTLMHESLPHVLTVPDARSQAFALLGLCTALQEFPVDRVLRQAQLLLAERLATLFQATREDPAWPWPEPLLTYANATLPHALIIAGHDLGRPELVEMASGALRWLAEIQHLDGHFVPIGNQGWYGRDGHRARFDQQPIEAAAAVEAYVAAFRVTGDRSWIKETMSAFRWFLGYNDLGMTLYDEGTGGCRDGLSEFGANENQGAESTLAWLSALAEVLQIEAAGAIVPDDESTADDLGQRMEGTTRLAS